MGQWSLRLANQILGIKSPSSAWITPWRIEAQRRFDPPAPWYSAHGPREPWETQELRNAARRVRRLIRRNWFDLLFDYDGNIAWEVRREIASPPKKPGSSSLLDAVIQLDRLGLVPKIDLDIADEFMKQCGMRLEDENESE